MEFQSAFVATIMVAGTSFRRKIPVRKEKRFISNLSHASHLNPSSTVTYAGTKTVGKNLADKPDVTEREMKST